MTDLADQIEDRAKEPFRAKGDQGEMEQHLLPDQIAAAKFTQGQTVAKGGGLGIRLAQIKAPGAPGTV